MTEVNGLVNSVQRVARGSELVAAAASGATVLFVDSAEDFDNAGGDLDVNGIRYEYVSSDIDADTVTLAAPGLTASAAESDAVSPVMGGQIAVDHVAYVSMGEGDEAEVIIPFAERSVWPEGFYEDPVPVVLSDDLSSIVAVDGRTPVIDGVIFQTSTTGQRVVMRNDGNGGVTEYWSGVDGETPNRVNPGVAVGTGTPFVQIKSGTTPTYLEQARLDVISGLTSGTSTRSRINLEAFKTFVGGGGLYVGKPAEIDGEVWVNASIASGFTNVSGQAVQYMLDAAGNTHIRGALNITSASSGDLAFTIPSKYRPTDRPATRPVLTQALAFAARADVDNLLGQVRLSWASGATAVRVDVDFPTF